MTLARDRRELDGYRASELLSPALREMSTVQPRGQLYPTLMDPLDRVLGGGFREHDLVLLGGRPGVGKTIVAMQWARAMARSGIVAIMASYEHDESVLLSRLIAMEMGMLELGPIDSETSSLLEDVRSGDWSANSIAGRHPLVRAAVAQVDAYAARLILLPAARLRLDIEQLEALVVEADYEHTALFVDYAQKVPVKGQASSWDEMAVRQIAERLKTLALISDSLVVAITAVDEDGLRSRRVRLQHLRSTAALSYEADVAIMMNDKALSASKVHLQFDLTKIEQFERRVIFSIEKNRGGRAHVDLEFEKDFARFRFLPTGGFVTETLIDGVLTTD